MKIRKMSGLLLISILLTSLIIFYTKSQNRLIVGGVTTYNGGEKYDIELINKGVRDIKVKKIISDDRIIEDVELVISYSNPLVAGGIDSNPNAKFLEISDEFIHPEMSSEEKNRAIKKGGIPLNYGIRLNNGKDIHSITIQYEYMGKNFQRHE